MKLKSDLQICLHLSSIESMAIHPFYLASGKWMALFLLFGNGFSLLYATQPMLGSTQHAERLFAESLYADAISFYKEDLNSLDKEEWKEELTLRLAHCHLQEQNPQSALDLLLPFLPVSNNGAFLYFSSLAYRQLQHPSKALNLLEKCPPTLPSSLMQHIHLEKGVLYFATHDHPHAEASFRFIRYCPDHPLPYYLAQIYLAKIAILTHRFQEAIDCLVDLNALLPSLHPLQKERDYLIGIALLAQHYPADASVHFENALAQLHPFQKEEYVAVIKALLFSQCELLLTPSFPQDQIAPTLSQCEVLLEKLLSLEATDTSYLLLGHFYLIKAKVLQDSSYASKGLALLKHDKGGQDPEPLLDILLKYIESVQPYEERARLYDELLHSVFDSPHLTDKVLFLTGLNHLKEGLSYPQDPSLSSPYFAKAALAFLTSSKHIRNSNTFSTLKYQALAYALQIDPLKKEEAWNILYDLVRDSSFSLQAEDGHQILYLMTWCALFLPKEKGLITQSLVDQDLSNSALSIDWKIRFLKLKGWLLQHFEEWEAADRVFSQLIQEFPHHQKLGEIWFWRAQGIQHLSPALAQRYFKEAYTQDVTSAFAPFAYFYSYSYQDYLKGDPKAFRHLEKMSSLFPSHPFTLIAHYLIGLYHKKNHFSEEGELIRRKDLTAAIDAFYLVETTSETLIKENRLPSLHFTYFLNLRYRAQFERAVAHLTIARNSQGAKKEIYLHYAENLFLELFETFVSPNSLAARFLLSPDHPYPTLWKEIDFQLAQTYFLKSQLTKGEAILDEALKRYQMAGITHNYTLSRTWYEKGKCAQERKEFEKALEAFNASEQATDKGWGLSPDEKLEGWIQKSLCYFSLQNFDAGMQLLSQVINEPVISPLRIKAMFLRAEGYALQGRHELAIKQLEAAAKQEGKWAEQSRQKLKEAYGY